MSRRQAHSFETPVRAPGRGLLWLWVLLAALSAGWSSAAEPAPAAGWSGAPRIRLALALNAEAGLEAAERLIQKRRWELALPMLQGLLDEGRERVIWDGRAYVPVADLVNERIASLPAEAQRVYALLYDAAAERLYAEGMATRSLTMLKQVAARYLNTTCGPRAVSAVASLLMDQGEFGAALLELSKADVLPPDEAAASTYSAQAAAKAKPIAVKKLMCLARLDLPEEAQRLVAALRAAGNDRFTVGGRQWECAAFTEDAFAGLAPVGEPTEKNAWASLGGNAAGNAAPPSSAPHDLFPLTVDLPWPGRIEPEWPSMPSTRPVAAEDAVFLNRDGTVLALDRRSLRVRWAAPPERATDLALAFARGEAFDAEPLPGYIPMGNIHHWRTFDNHGLATLSLANGRLFAVQFDPLKIVIPDQPWAATPDDMVLANELRCYNADTGALLWSAGRYPGWGRRGGRDRPAATNDCWFFTAPTVHKGRAYVLAARTGRLHALCLDAETGQPLWDSPIGALESRQQMQRFCMEFFLADTSPPAVAQGIVVYPTGQGIVCAYSAYDGQLLWMAPYPRSAEWLRRLGQRVNVPSGSWLPRQPLIKGGRCLLTPMDSGHVVALSLKTGALLWQAHFPNGTALLGERDGRVYVQHANLTCLDAETGRFAWEAGLPGSPVGAGALAQDSVLVPERTGIRIVDARTGRNQKLLPWPAGAETGGNLLLLGDALVICSPESLTVCPAREDALAIAEAGVEADPQGYQPLLRRAALAAELRQIPRAAADIERAVALAQATHDKRAVWHVRRRAARDLVRLAVKSGHRDLLDSAAQLAPPGPALKAELAVAELRLALQQLEARNVAAVYLRLCRHFGMLQEKGQSASASLWTELAEVVRGQCIEDRQLAQEWQDLLGALIEEATASQDATALQEITRWAPFPVTKTAALLRLGGLWEKAGRTDRARRAFAEIVISDGLTQDAEQATGMLEKLFATSGRGALAQDYIQALQAKPGAAELRQVPTSCIAWSASGFLVTPAQPLCPLLRGKVLVVDGRELKCLKATDGTTLWTTELLPEPDKAVAADSETETPWRYIGPGCPAYCLGTPGALVALPSGMFGVGARSGVLLWRQTSGAARARVAAHQPIPRMELIQHARRGLPVPPPDALLRELLMDSFVCGPLAGCMVLADRKAIAVDPLTGQVILERTPTTPGGLRGVHAAVAGAKLCLALQKPSRLLVFDLKDGEPLAEWTLHRSPFIRSLMVTPDHHALLADYRSIVDVDLRLMKAAAEWPVAGGVNRLIYADQAIVLLRTMDGRTVGLDRQTGSPCIQVGGAEDPEVVWAERREDVLYVLEAAELRRRIPYGPETHFQGSGFVLRAVRLPDASPVWSVQWPEAPEQVVGPPVRCERFWLLRAGEPGRIRIVGAESRTGRQLFAIELDGYQRPWPLALLVSAGRLIVGTHGTVSALQPGPQTIEEAIAAPQSAPR